MTKPGERIPTRAELLVAVAHSVRCSLTNRSRLSGAAEFVEMVQRERARQDEKWGLQNDLNLDRRCTILTEELGEFAKEVNEIQCDRKFNLTGAIVELVQVAAVAQSIYEQYFYSRVEQSDGRGRGIADE